MRLVLVLLLSSLASAQGMGGKSGIGGKAGFGGGVSGGSSHTFTHVAASGGTCTVTTSTCAATITSTGTGNLVVCGFAINNTDTLSSVTSPNNTWVVAASGGFSFTGGALWWAYTLSSVAGDTTITAHFTGAPTSPVGACSEESFTGAGALTFDTGNTASNATSASPAGATLTITGTNDAEYQMIWPSTSASGVSAGWTTVVSFASFGSNGIAFDLNLATGTAPTWTTANNTSFVGGIAIK